MFVTNWEMIGQSLENSINLKTPFALPREIQTSHFTIFFLFDNLELHRSFDSFLPLFPKTILCSSALNSFFWTEAHEKVVWPLLCIKNDSLFRPKGMKGKREGRRAGIPLDRTENSCKSYCFQAETFSVGHCFSLQCY